ncbi:MAG: RNA polymerase sigma factor, partial [Bacteroidales bacterium]|nr:RNA polymerase sigma factor [Bacteroidales bacterium]
KTMTQIDSKILNQCISGDRNAFRVIVKTYQRMVFSLTLKMLCNEDEAKDMVQETFIKVWQNLPKFDPQKTLSTWIYTIATRLCLDRIKLQKHTYQLPDDDTALRNYATHQDAQTELENSEWVQLVTTLTNGLSPKQKLVFTLIQLEGLESSEVEEITGMDSTQVKSNLYQSRKNIKERLTKLGYE